MRKYFYTPDELKAVRHAAALAVVLKHTAEGLPLNDDFDEAFHASLELVIQRVQTVDQEQAPLMAATDSDPEARMIH